MGVDKASVRDMKNLLNKYKSKLDSNHGVLTELKQMIVSGYGRLPGYMVEDMKEADHMIKIQLAQEILAVLDIVEPGLNLPRGLILFELHTSFVMAANIQFEKSRNPNQLLVRLLEAENFLNEADKIIRLEPASSPYGHLVQTIQMNKHELAEYIQNVK